MALPKFQSRKFAEGGMAPQGAPQPAAQPGGDPAAGGGGPEQQIQAALQQYAQTKDPQLAVQICDALVSMQGGGGGAPAQPDPSAGGMGGPAGPDPAQMAAKGGKLRSFGNMGGKGEKPAFGVPAKAAPAGTKAAAPAKSAGKPMSADQKLKAKKFGNKK